MINITVGDIEKVTEGKLIYGERDIICENFCRDSREIEPGDTYIGIKGERGIKEGSNMLNIRKCKHT